MNKTRINYLLDAVIAGAFLLSAGTGVAFLFLGESGYQGGRNAAYAATLLGLSRHTWTDLHTWASLVLIAGVVVHFALHWKWIVCVTRQWVQALPHRQEKSCEVPA